MRFVVFFIALGALALVGEKFDMTAIMIGYLIGVVQLMIEQHFQHKKIMKLFKDER